MSERAPTIYKILEVTKSGNMLWAFNSSGESFTPGQDSADELFVYYTSDPTPSDLNRQSFKLYREKIGSQTYKYILEITKITSISASPPFTQPGGGTRKEIIDDEMGVKDLWDYLNGQNSLDTESYVSGL